MALCFYPLKKLINLILTQVYLLEIDKILFHDNKRQGFSILDPATNTVVKETTRSAGYVLSVAK